ncbi:MULTISPECIES: DUF1499 domain-containing protein [unclassified Psychrobacter]|uniref:DUF1499 domain-containing protein n=1 Tax=unclassified Psychrobacter TaxID=196806 RepID=UPI0025B3D436|nr:MULTISPECIES: DUF1499 domain-containing protein [unclassified Psychrobacter]MDN3452023.1 DUF1499 domain-containing protein [Psychrobacter sp. APC 3350]MDN3503449.1 DUF1499 domain-containing protein [Psychrobacter sp. 5A.1]
MKVLVSMISLIAFLLVALPAPLYRFGVVELGTAFAGFKFGLVVGIAALVLLAIQVLFKRKTVSIASAAIAVIFSAIAIALPLGMMTTAKNVPPIHDISTDVVNPPEFVAIAPLRTDAPNPVEYAGAEAAEQQRTAYPDLQTLTYSQSKPELVEASKKAVENLGWELVNTDADKGIVEATETTAWFGFKDDVIIRVTDNDSERLVDIRSKSRIGKSDLGKNAARIHALIDELDSVLSK